MVLSFNVVAALQDLRMRNWPVAAGHILEATVSRDVVGVEFGRRSNRRILEHRLHASYEYVVASTSYVGTRIGRRDAAARVMGEKSPYAFGQAVSVHYNASQPSEAVIEAPFPAANILGAALAGLMLFIGYPAYRRARTSGT